MTRDPERRPRRSRPVSAPEQLEDRRLLSGFYSGISATRPVQSGGGVFTLQISGPGFEKVRQVGHGAVAVTLYGTTSASTLNVALTRQKLHKPATNLSISSIKVVTGSLGGINAPAANLLGAVTPLTGSVGTLQFADLGPNTQIDVKGSLGSLSVSGGVGLGPNGHFKVAGDVSQGVTVGSFALAGGQFIVGHDVDGAFTAGSVTLTQGGQLLVTHDLAVNAQVNGNVSVSGNSLFGVGHNLDGLTVAQGVSLDSGGRLAIGNDLAGSLNVNGTLTVTGGAQVFIGRDLTGSLHVGQDAAFASGGNLAVGRTLNAVQVDGNLAFASGGLLQAGGDLTSLKVNGALIGNGTPTPDINVGLNLGSLTVLGGGADQGGIQNASIAVGKNLLGLNVTHGIFDSFITAAVLIDGGSGGSGGTGNVGADGADAVLNSEIRAGVEINHLTIDGNVRSTFVSKPQSPGYRTRIIAGEDRAGNYSSGGLIDNFQITGQLIDSVVAASVEPGVGDGTLPPTGYGTARVAPPAPNGFNNDPYDAPAGTITGGTVGTPVTYPNYTEISYYNETATGTAYATNPPTLLILPGAINPSFASAPLSQTALTTSSNVQTTVGGVTTTTTVSPSTTQLPLPTQSTVLGGVVSTAINSGADNAGLFAANTRGVFIGSLPSS